MGRSVAVGSRLRAQGSRKSIEILNPAARITMLFPEP
jgi:hypothetical protein